MVTAAPQDQWRLLDVQGHDTRLTQLARRRKVDMPAAVAAALDGPQLSPEGRDRAQAFLELYRAAGPAFENRRPDAFVRRLVERVGVRRQQVFATQADTVERLRNIARLPELATRYMRREPLATPRDFTRYLQAVADSGLPEPEATVTGGAPAVAILDVADAKGREFDHVFVLGLSAARMPGRAPADDPAGPALAAPGEAPAIDTGNLLNSGYHKMTGPTEGEVGFGAEYAVYLEMGSVRMAPRPFLGPAVERVWPEFVKAMEQIP